MFLSKLKQFLVNNKKTIFYIGFFLIIYNLSCDFVSAEGEVPATGKAATDEMINEVATILNGLLEGMSLILGLLSYLVSLFLSPGWINGSFFGLTGHFKELWILVSNIVYFIFAFILIWIAFMNIIGSEGENTQLKQVLPRFVIGILIIPFSWFIVQFVLSLSAILTISALTLPSDTFGDYKGKLEKVEIPKICTINLQGSGGGPKESGGAASASDSFYCGPEDTNKVPLSEVLGAGESSTSIFGIVATYTYGIMKIDKLNDISKGSIMAGVETIGDLVVKIVFDFLFIIVYAILMITFCLVLLVRGVYIWMFIIFSPVFGLMYFFKEKGGEGLSKMFNIKEFIGLAMVPVYAMLALSFGLLFIYVVGDGMTSTEKSKVDLANESLANQGIKLERNGAGKEAVDVIKLGSEGKEFTLEIKGVVGESESSNSGLFQGEGNPLGVIGTLILHLFGIMVLWGAVMAAMKTSKITETLTSPIAKFGEDIGGIVKQAPMYAPVFGGQSMQSMKRVSGSVQSHFDTKTSNEAAKFLQNTPFGSSASNTAEYNKIRDKAGMMNAPQLTNAVRKTLSLAGGNYKKVTDNSASRETLFALAEQMIPKELGLLGIETANDIRDLPQLTKLLKAMDKDSSKFAGIYEGGTLSNEGEVEKLVKELGKEGVVVDVKDNSKNVVGDMRSTGIRDWDSNVDLKNKTIVIKKDETEGISGKGTVYIKNRNGNGGNMYNVEIQGVGENDTNLTGVDRDDVKELVKLYEKVGLRDDDMKKVLIGLGLKEVLVDDIKKEYNNQKI